MTSKTQQVKRYIVEKIQWQIFHANERIPSVRDLASKLSVSPYTVSQAYDALVAEGVIYAQKGSGYFVAEPYRDIAPAVQVPTMTNNVLDTGWLLGHLFSDLPAENCSGSGVLQADWLYPQASMLKAQKKAVRSLNYVYGYGNIQGFLLLREQLSLQLSHLGIHAHPSCMVTTTGVSAGIDTIVRAMCQSGDYVVVDDPCWFWMIGCLQQLGLNVLGVTRDEQGVNIEELRYLLTTYKPKLYLTNSVFHNPTSFNLPPQNIYTVLKLMEAHDCYVIEDDVYSYYANEHHSKNMMRYATLDGLQRVFYLTGISKVLGGNWRIGLACCPEQHLEKVLRQKMLTNMTCPEITERTIFHVWQDPQYAKHLRTMRKRLGDAHHSLAKKLENIGIDYPKHTNPSLFVWVDVGVDTAQMALDAHKEGWLVAPGHLFSATGKYKTHLRLNVTRTSDVFLAWLAEYMRGIVNG